MAFTHDNLPRPAGKVHKFPDITKFSEAVDYALSGYHACIDQMGKAMGQTAIAWEDAAKKYAAAHAVMQALKAAGDTPTNVQNAKNVLNDANAAADKAGKTKANA